MEESSSGIMVTGMKGKFQSQLLENQNCTQNPPTACYDMYVLHANKL